MPDYETQVQKLKRANRAFMATLAAMAALFLFFSVWFMNMQLQAVKRQLLTAQQAHKATTEENLGLNRAQACILATLPVEDRTPANVDFCFKENNVNRKAINLPQDQ